MSSTDAFLLEFDIVVWWWREDVARRTVRVDSPRPTEARRSGRRASKFFLRLSRKYCTQSSVVRPFVIAIQKLPFASPGLDRSAFLGRKKHQSQQRSSPWRLPHVCPSNHRVPTLGHSWTVSGRKLQARWTRMIAVIFQRLHRCNLCLLLEEHRVEVKDSFCFLPLALLQSLWMLWHHLQPNN